MNGIWQAAEPAPEPPAYPLNALDFIGITLAVTANVFGAVAGGLGAYANEFYCAARHARKGQEVADLHRMVDFGDEDDDS